MTRKKKASTNDVQPVETKETKPMSTVLDDSVLEFDEDISNAEMPEPLPAGIYFGEIQSATVGESKTSGNRMLTVTVVIPTEEYPPDAPDLIEEYPEGVTMRHYQPATNRASHKARMRTFCEMVGVTPASKLDMSEFLGKRVKVETYIDEYNGEQSAKIRRFLGKND